MTHCGCTRLSLVRFPDAALDFFKWCFRPVPDGSYGLHVYSVAPDLAVECDGVIVNADEAERCSIVRGALEAAEAWEVLGL